MIDDGLPVAAVELLDGYPGRVVGRHVDGSGADGWLYLLTGRSPQSRRRAIRPDDRGLAVGPVEPSAEPGAADPLRHYRCARAMVGGGLVVGNGDHVDGVADGLEAGADLATTVDDIEPEPDGPIFTPRIVLVMANGTAQIAAVRYGTRAVAERFLLDLGSEPSTLTLLATYSAGVERPVGSAPMRRIALDADWDLDRVARAVWTATDPGLRVALVAGAGTSPEPVVSLP